MMKPAALMIALAALTAGCASTENGPEAELTQEQVCLAHFENDPVERDRCRQDANNRRDTPRDVRPMELPVRTGQMGD